MPEPVDSGRTSPDILRTEADAKAKRFEDRVNSWLDNAKKSKEKDPQHHKRYASHTYYVDEEGREGARINYIINQVPEIDETISRAPNGSVSWKLIEDRKRSPSLRPQITVVEVEKIKDGDIRYVRREDKQTVEYSSANPDHLGKIDRVLDKALKILGA